MLSPRRAAAAITAILCGWVAYAVSSAISTGHAVDSRVRDLQAQDAALQQQITERRREIALAQTRAWVEEEARRSGYVMPGEIVYLLLGGGAPPPAAGGGVQAQLPTFNAAGPSPGSTPAAAPSPTDAIAPASPSPTPFSFDTGASPSPH